MDDLVGQSMDRYEILDLLGEGGMGAVYKARDVTLQRDVAIKVLHRHISRQADFEARFLQEARSAARLDHPGIVQVYDFNQALGKLYIVMKLIAGANLRQMLEELKMAGKWVPLDEGVQLVRQVSLTLNYAHERGVLHRDIKPQNIMIEPEPSDGLPYRPVITDLGLAKLTEGGFETRQGSSIGTPAFMSPEQALGQQIDARSDVYSLGVLLYELVVGRVPFPAKTITEAIRYHTKVPPPPPRSIRPDLPLSLERIILQALEKEPDRRFPDALTFARALHGVLPMLAESTLAPTVRENAVSLITQYQHSLDKPRDVPILKEFDTPADLNQDVIHILVQGNVVNTVTITSSRITIGRMDDNDIMLDDASSSRHHARIETDGNEYRIIDLDSRNGTFLANTRLLPGMAELWTPGKTVRIGSTWLHLVRAQKPESGATFPLKGGTAESRDGQTSIGQGWVGMLLEAAHLAVEPGGSIVAKVSVLNQGPLVDHFQVSVDGVPADWVSIPPSLIRLLPGQQQAVTLVIHPPKLPQSRAGQHPLTIRVTSQNDPQQMAEIGAILTVAAYHMYSLNIRPRKQSGLIEGNFTLQVNNQCNTSLTVQFDAVDIEDGCQYTFDPSQTAVMAGQEQQVKLNVLPKLPLRGEATRNYPFTVTARSTEAPELPQQIQAIWVQTPPVYEVSLDPQTQSGISRGTYTVKVTNLGQTELSVRLEAMDAGRGCQYNFNPAQVTVPVGQEQVVQLGVVPRTPLSSKETRSYPFTVTVQTTQVSGFIQQVKGEWIQTPPELDLSLDRQEQSGAAEGSFSVHLNNQSKVGVTVQWEAVGQDADCRYTFTPTRSTVPAGGEHRVQLKITSNTPPPMNIAKTHPFTVTARLATAPQLTWQTQGKWVRNVQPQVIQPITPQRSAEPVTKNPRRFWGCLVMIIGVILTIAFGLFLGNIAFEALGLDDTGAWIAAVIGWIIGIIVTRSLAQKVTKG